VIKKRGELMNAVLVLTTGTVLAQAIGYLISPILTRIYSTEEMGDMGVYLRAIGFIAALGTVRYEMALPLPKNDSHSYLLYKVSLKIAIYILIACTILGVLFLFTQPFSWGQVGFVSLTLLGSLVMVFINLGTNWAIRKKQFRVISISKMINAFSSNGLRWLFGLIGMGSFGLILATFLGFLLSSFSFLKDFKLLKTNYKHYESPSKTAVLLSEYKQFPLVSLPHVLMDLGRDLLIASLIIYFFSKDIFGSYNHSYTILRLPLMVIGTSIGQVFYNRCSEIVNEGKSIYPLIKKTMIILIALSIVPFGLIFIFGEPLFGFVFSDTWRESGYFSEIMTPWLMMNFIISPVSSIPMILNRQKEYFIIGLIGTFMQLFCFGILPLILGTSKDAFVTILWVMSISQALFLVFGVFYALYISKIGVKQRVRS
jgi:O-antigen/teichoic acid export membrane protein